LKSGAAPVVAILVVACAMPAWAEYEYDQATDAYGQFWEIEGPVGWVGPVSNQPTYGVYADDYIVTRDGMLVDNPPLECYLFAKVGDVGEFEEYEFVDGSEGRLETADDVVAWDMDVGFYFVECEVMYEGLELLHEHDVYITTQETYDYYISLTDNGGGAGEAPTVESTPGVVDLPPVFLNQPASETVTPMGNQYALSLDEGDFLVIDDSEATVECTVKEVTSTIGPIPSMWRLDAGMHDVQCTATDAGGNASSITYTITVIATSGLYASENYEQRIERIARLGAVGALNDEHVLKAVKYFHRAGALVFDIGSSDGVGEAPAQPACSSPVTASSVIGVMANTDHSNDQVKHCLELLAEQGDFSGVSLGI